MGEVKEAGSGLYFVEPFSREAGRGSCVQLPFAFVVEVLIRESPYSIGEDDRPHTRLTV